MAPRMPLAAAQDLGDAVLGAVCKMWQALCSSSGVVQGLLLPLWQWRGCAPTQE